jgi:hypothetical protein
MDIKEIALELRKLADKIEAPATIKEAPKLDLETVRGLLATKSRSGKTAEIKQLLTSFGAEKVSAVKPEDYAALYKAANEL